MTVHEQAATFEAAIDEAMRTWHVPGVSVGTLVDGEYRCFAKGVANIVTGLAVEEQTLFQVASISKPYTATLAARLVTDGLLGLDQPVVEYLPDFRLEDETATRQVTLRHLLTHSAGFEGSAFDYGAATLASASEVIGAFGKVGQVVEPGQLWAYCNSCFALIGAIAAHLTGSSFEVVMREQVFEPLGLTHSFYLAEEVITMSVAVGHMNHLNSDGTWGPVRDVSRNFALSPQRLPQGGLITNAADLMRFASFHLGDGSSEDRVLIEPGLLGEMQEPQIKATGSADAYGLGWAIRSVGGEKVIGHGGLNAGYRAHLALVPKRRSAIAVLTNSESGGGAILEIVDAFFETFLGLTREDQPIVGLGPKAQEVYVGEYSLPNLRISVSIEGDIVRLDIVEADRVTLVPTERPPVRIRPLGSHEFLVLDGPSIGTKADFVVGASGRAEYMRYQGRLLRRLPNGDQEVRSDAEQSN